MLRRRPLQHKRQVAPTPGLEGRTDILGSNIGPPGPDSGTVHDNCLAMVSQVSATTKGPMQNRHEKSDLSASLSQRRQRAFSGVQRTYTVKQHPHLNPCCSPAGKTLDNIAPKPCPDAE